MLVVAMMLYAMTMGFAGAAQGPTNAALGKHVGVMQAALVSFTGGFLAAVLINIVLYLVRGYSGVMGALECQPWELMGGPLGAFVVFGFAYATPRLGAALTITLEIMSQMVFSFVIDGLGLMGVEKVAAEPLRVLGCVLLLAGVMLVYRGRMVQARKEGNVAVQKKPAGAVLIMLAAGAAAAVQLPINVALRSHTGLMEAIVVHFGIGALVLLVLVLATNKGRLPSLKGIPLWMDTGGLYGVYGVTSLIITMPVLGTGLNTAANQLGQLIGGVAVDAFGFFRTPKSPINSWRIAGIVVLLAGIVAIALPQI